MASRRQHTAADFRPLRPEHRESSATASNIGRHAIIHSDRSHMSRPSNERNNTAPIRMRRSGTATTSGTLNTISNQNATTRAEKKQDQTVEVDNEYFTLNPWYNQQKEKPVFGLASPLPRTVRRGMWWGRGDLRNSLYKIDEGNNNRIDRRDALQYNKSQGECLPSHCYFLNTID